MGSHHGHGHEHHDEHDHGHGHHHAHKKDAIQKLVKLAVLALAVTAVVKELRLPPPARTWNGVVAGFVPYDFRVPTLDRVKEKIWDPEGDHLLSPHVFGVGWTVNVGRIVALARAKVSR